MSIRSLPLLLMTTVLGASRPAAAESYDWSAWGNIVVQEGGRMKPLDTLASELVIGIVGRGSFQPRGFGAISVADITHWESLAEKIVAGSRSQSADPQTRVAKQLSKELLAKLEHVNLKTAEFEATMAEADAALKTLRERDNDPQRSPLTYGDWLAAVVPTNSEAARELARYQSAKAKLDQADNCQATLIIELNELLAWPGLYDAAHWPQDQVPQPAKELLARGPANLSAPELGQLNRALIQSAYPDEIRSLEPASVNPEPRKYAALELYVTWLLTWQGWDKLSQVDLTEGKRDDETYWKGHEADGWDRIPLLDARHQAMRDKLKPETRSAVSVRTIPGNLELQNWVMGATEKYRNNEKEQVTPWREEGRRGGRGLSTFHSASAGVQPAHRPQPVGGDAGLAPLDRAPGR